ncbi:MAG: DUF2793 domain-containing protein [Rhodobacteraceae bacterium]|nr:DUF2793 domain-containing protein [Alphaproteobacteria bacterium]NNK68591.1 DUF2793 domain-containing protein [Paracoccaceae bacterium]
MDSTTTLRLPLVQAAQAQKHVTVNEALVRLDALVELTLASRAITAPPGTAEEGACYAVPAGAVNAWDGQAGRLALFVGGGWDFLDPVTGWRAWIADEGVPGVFDGVDWVAGSGAVSPNGAAFVQRVVEFDHTIATGPSSDTIAAVPGNALVYGVSGRVLSAIGGTATSWQLGIGGVSPDRYGSGLGLAAGSWVRGLTSTPIAYYSDTALTLTGAGGDLSGGVVRLAVHIAELTLPRA